MYPGDSVQVEKSEPIVLHMPGAHTREDISQYREARRGDWENFYVAEGLPIGSGLVAAHFASLQRFNKHFLQGFHKTIKLCSGGKACQIELGGATEFAVVESEDRHDAEYTIVLPPRVLRAIIQRRTG